MRMFPVIEWIVSQKDLTPEDIQKMAESSKDVEDAIKATKAVTGNYFSAIQSVTSNLTTGWKILIALIAAAVALFILKFVWNILFSWVGPTVALRKYKKAKVPTHQEKLDDARRLASKGRLREAAETFLAAGEPELAAETYEKAGEKNHAATIYIQHGQHSKAAVILVSLGRYQDAARAFAHDGNYQEAADAMERSGDAPGAARMFEQIGQFSKAAKLYEDAGNPYKAALMYGKAGDNQHEARLMATLVKQGVTREMLSDEDLNKVLEECSYFEPSAAIYMEKKQFAKAAVALVRGGRLDKAIEVYSMTGSPPTQEVLSAISYADKEGAQKFAQFFLKARDFRSAATVFDNLGRYEEAGSLAERYGDYYYSAQMYGLAGKPDKQALSFERAGSYIEAAGTYMEAGNPGKAGDMYYMAKKLDQALEMYKKAGDEGKVVACMRAMGAGPAGAAAVGGAEVHAASSEARRKTSRILKDQAGIAEALGRSPLLSSLSMDEISIVQFNTRTVQYQAGSKIITQGTDGGALYIIKAGQAEVVLENSGRMVGLSRLGEGEHFGEISVLFGMPATATVRASTDLEAVRIQREDLQTIMLKQPVIGNKFFRAFTRVLADRLVKTNAMAGTVN